MSTPLDAVPAHLDHARRRRFASVRIASPSLTRVGESRLVPIAVAALSLVLGLVRIDRVGYANTYYAAAVRSMLDNWHAFFFASYDSAGFVTVDKPPLGLWIQTIFAMALGFHGWSILLPQMLASAGSVLVLHHLVRRVYGPIAALLAALALAVAPINVAASRNNTSDTVLVFVLLLATLALSRALERGSVRWFCLCMALVGVGFNIKMLQAYLVLPALLLAWLLTPANLATQVAPSDDAADAVEATPWPRRRWRNRIGGLLAGGVVLLLVSFSWTTVVELTPADERPYVGSSSSNSVFNLIFEYNGLNRLLPNGWSIFGITNGSSSGGSPGGGGVGGVSENGPRGVLRLINANLGGQIGWLLPLAMIGLLAAWGLRRWWRMDRARLALVIWGGWFLTQATFFSIAGFYHRYYLSMLSPAVAALAGIGVVALWRAYRAGGGRALLLPAALAATAAVQLKILDDYPTWRDRLLPVLALLIGGAMLGLLLVRLRPPARLRGGPIAAGLASAGVLALLIAPAVWSGITVTEANPNTTLPVAGPSVAGDGAFGGGNRPNGGQDANVPAGGANSASAFGAAADSELLAYLVANKGDATWVVAVNSANSGSSIILATNEPVMAMGGFGGGDPILTVDSFQALVAEGKIRFVLGDGSGVRGGMGPRSSSSDGRSIGDDQSDDDAFGDDLPPQTDAPDLGGGSAGPGGGQSDVLQWVQQTCAVVPASDYSTAGSNQTLYDCQGAATAS